jgi:hypothetical protein
LLHPFAAISGADRGTGDALVDPIGHHVFI